MKIQWMIFVAALALIPAACGNSLFDAASRSAGGTTMAAVATYDAGAAKVIVTDGRDYTRQLGDLHLTTEPTRPVFVVFTGSNAIFVSMLTTVYSYAGSGSWATSGGIISNNIIGLATDNTVLALTNTTYDLYEYHDHSDIPWAKNGSFSSALPEGSFPIGLIHAPGSGAYVITQVQSGSTAGNILLIDIHDPSIVKTRVKSLPDGAFFFTVSENIFFAGTEQVLGDSSGSIYTTMPYTIFTYAVINPSTVFAVGTDATSMNLLKLDKATATFVKICAVGTALGTMVMDYLDSDRLLIGVSGANSPADNGLYIYTVSTATLKMINPSSVYGIAVNNR